MGERSWSPAGEEVEGIWLTGESIKGLEEDQTRD